MHTSYNEQQQFTGGGVLAKMSSTRGGAGASINIIIAFYVVIVFRCERSIRPTQLSIAVCLFFVPFAGLLSVEQALARGGEARGLGSRRSNWRRKVGGSQLPLLAPRCCAGTKEKVSS